MNNIQHSVSVATDESTSTDERTLSRMGGLSRQRNAMLASRETMVSQLTNQFDVVADLTANLDDLRETDDQHPVVSMRLRQARQRLAQIVSDIEDLDSRIAQYKEQLNSLVSVRETGEVVEPDEIGMA